jgi:integrase
MHKLNKLSKTNVKAAKPRQKAYTLADGGGLVLQVQPNGSLWWRLRYRHNSIAKMISLGTFPDTDLDTARDRRDDARKLIANGIDPSAKRLAEKAASSDSFQAMAEEYLAHSDAHESTLETTRQRLEAHVFPRIGKLPIADITSQQLLLVLRRVEARGTIETAHRIRTNCGQVFRFAVATGRAVSDPAEALKGALKPVKAKHMATITNPKQIGELMRAIDGYQGHAVSVAALKLAPLVFARPGELRAAEWSEIDLNAAEWRIRAERTKMKTEHIVPLSTQAVSVLKEVHPLTGNGRYVFPSVRTVKRPMSENTLTAALRRMGYTGEEMSWHGFRGMASTSLHEQGFPSAHIERQLGHGERNKVKAAYNHAEHLPARKKMMQTWADYLDAQKSGAKITPIHKASAPR